MKIPEGMTCCPHCGYTEFMTKDYYVGTAYWRYTYSGEEADNTGYWDSLTEKRTSKYVYCAKCEKRLFKVED